VRLRPPLAFCGKHDSAAFKPLEETPFACSPEQCFLIGFIALCHEGQKTGVVRSYARVRVLVDRGLRVEDQDAVQVLWPNLNVAYSEVEMFKYATLRNTLRLFP